MRRRHRRRCQGRFTRLASLARSLTSPASAGLLLALAALLVITPAQGKAQSATYRVTFEGKWTTAATPDGVPGGAHFSPLIAAVHNDQVTFWSEGGTASAGIESMAEVGGTNAFKTDITAAGSNAGAVIERIGNIGATATVTADFTVTSTHPLVTLLSMIAPSPDWFVGVSGLSLRNATDDGWQPSLTVDLFPYDAGTKEGTEFSPSNAATSPQGTITSIKGTGKFSDEPIASLTFTLQAVAPEITSAATFTVDEGTTAVETLTAKDQDTAETDLTWSIPTAGGADAGQFMLSTSGSVLPDGPVDEAQTVVRGPYLQSGTSSSVIIKWRTDEATDSVVRYGLDPDSLTLSATNSDSTTEHAVQLTGLSADVKYFYSVGTSSDTLAGGDSDHFVVTAPVPGTAKPTRIWVIGDSGTANANAGAVRDAFLNFTESRDPDLWIMLGDNAYSDGTDDAYQRAVFEIYPQVLRRTVLWSTLGNHDGHTADSTTESGPYYDIFSLPRNGEAGGVPSRTEAYYSFDYGNMHFICLDSYETDRSPDGAMMTWLEADLAANDKEWIIAFWHHPPYSKGTRDSDTQERSIELRQNAVPLLERYGVDLVLAGHSHSYERSYLIDGHYGLSNTFTDAMKKRPGDGSATGDGAYQKPAAVASPHAGAVYVVAGSSGKRKEGPFGHPAMVVSMATLGSMVLDVNGNRLDAMFLDSTGNLRDDFTILKLSEMSGSVPEITSAATFTVDEGTTAVETLTAEDQDTAETDLTWSIPTAGGADAGQFTLSSAGVLAFAAAKDYENPDDADGDRTYEITVQVSDGDNTDTADIRVTLQNVLELFTELEGPSSTDYAENRAVRVATYIASSPEDSGGIAWSLSGADSGGFSIDGGALRFLSLPDFESPSDMGTDNMYSLTVAASDGSANVTKDVTVTVTDENEAGAISLSTVRPKVGSVLTAALTDPDGVTAGTVTWQWERSTGPNAWVVIAEAEAASYTPVAADGGNYLRATATYTDRHPGGKQVRAVPPNVVLAHRLSRLEVTTSSSRSMYPAFDPEILHYAVGCQDTLTLTLSTRETDTRLAVNGIQRANRDVAVELTGLAGGSDIPITLTGSEGASTTYVLHCLADEFPAIITEKKPGAWDGLITIGVPVFSPASPASYLAMIDNNGVPRIHWWIFARVRIFRTHRDGRYPYSYGKQVLTRNVIVLDENLESVDTVTTVPPLQTIDLHDFVIKSNGNYLLLAYEPARRDMSQFTNSDGNPYGTTELTRDSVIQEVTPDKEEAFNWNSWDHMAVEDCTQHRFPDDYAHVNSVQAFDDDIVASFRGCSKVLRIDGDSGDVIWRLGKSNRSDADWTASGAQPPLRIVGDPYGEFCGQHSARMIGNGNLLLFDNGVACLVDPEGNRTRPGEDFSRVVEYAIDPDHGEAVFQRHYSYHGEFNKLAPTSRPY